jgi:acetyl-CoA carboxylase carboxyl transferase subunit alpha
MLECEKEILNLKKRLDEIKEFAIEKELDLSSEIDKLKNEIHDMEVKVYELLSPMDKLTLSRMIERPTSLDYIERIFDNFIEFHGDRQFRDDPCIVGGIAKLNDIAVTVIGQQKGRNMKENIFRNFGMPNPEGYRKALRLMKQAEKFNRPVICFVDTPGAYPGMGAEERGQGEAIARNLMKMSSLKVPIITIVIGEGGSGGALAMSVADEIWMLEHAVYSILTPEGFATILWKDSKRAKEAADIMKITAKDLKEFNIIDKIIKEPLGGAHINADETAAIIKNYLVDVPFEEMKNNIQQTIELRYKKYRDIGIYSE